MSLKSATALALLLLVCHQSSGMHVDSNGGHQVLQEPAPTASQDRDRYFYTPAGEQQVGSAFLAGIQDALVLSGYQPAQQLAQAGQLWTLESPFDMQVSCGLEGRCADALSRHPGAPLLNQRPGSRAVSSKYMVAAWSTALPFLPRTYCLPRQYAEWQAFLATPEGAGMAWLRKGVSHTGVSLIPDPRPSAFPKTLDGMLVQQHVPPFLIHGRAWDLGLYVVVTSVDPLLAYMHTGAAVLRVAAADHPATLQADTPADAYVVPKEDFGLPEEYDGVQALFPHAGPDVVSVSEVLDFLARHGVDSAALWLEAQSQVTQLLQRANPLMRNSGGAVSQDDYTVGRNQSVLLMRADFIMGADKQLYLLEVNMVPETVADGHDLALQPRRRGLVMDLLTLSGLARGGRRHPDTPAALRAAPAQPAALEVPCWPYSSSAGGPAQGAASSEGDSQAAAGSNVAPQEASAQGAKHGADAAARAEEASAGAAPGSQSPEPPTYNEGPGQAARGPRGGCSGGCEGCSCCGCGSRGGSGGGEEEEEEEDGTPRCAALCARCRSGTQASILGQVQAEGSGAHGFLRIHPPHRALAAHMASQGVGRAAALEKRPHNALVRTWLAARCSMDPRWC